jgi:penicillin-binding protein 1C
MMKKVKKRYVAGVGLLIALVIYYFCLPNQLFDDHYSTVIEDQHNELLSASIASDGQWRFPETDSIPEKFKQAIVTYEDKRFWSHPGVDVFSFGRAINQNIKKNKVVSGGSTITMQVIRLSRNGESRTVVEKIIEMILATRLEVHYSKNEILNLYASHAPFGGNVVGLEAASWRYFGRKPADLSWGETAMLAVLPNAPSLIHPGKNRALLKAKRDKLLDKLKSQSIIDDFTCALAKSEPIPEEPHALPRYARHLITRMMNDGLMETKQTSTIDIALQKQVEQILQDHHQSLSGNKIFNAAALVLDVKTGNVLAYAGNVKNEQRHHSDDVDVIASPRSTGSILKPFLFAALLDEGLMLQKTLQPDIPTMINGFSPKNFSKQYDGAVHADKALIRSLNIPAVHMLKTYRYEKFHTLLKNIGMSTLNKPADHYGLTLILGGAEGTLWDITAMYASMARTLNNFYEHPGKNKYCRNDFHPANYIINKKNTEAPAILDETSWLSASSIYVTFDALKELYRPGEETGWRYFNSSKKIAWKTGTSFGFRDGWAVGVTSRYAVGVWVGNADGEGRPGLTGTDAAAPIMFSIFSQLQNSNWFTRPEIEMQKALVCKQSGHRATALCEEVDTLYISLAGNETKLCPYHQKIHVTKDHRYRVHSGCVSMNQMDHVNWFILPPVQEYYVKSKNPSYKTLPPFKGDCQVATGIASMELIYPKHNARIFIPRELNGQAGSAVFELAHQNPGATVYWHLDGQFIGSTSKVHHLAFNPDEGVHLLTLVDDSGETIERHFSVISKM